LLRTLGELRQANAEAEARGIEPEPPLASFGAEVMEPEAVMRDEFETDNEPNEPARRAGVGLL